MKIAARLASFALIALVSPALAEPVSPWARDGSSALRLVDAGAAGEGGSRLAAITIQLDPGWKTYWRQPGASGVPPRFDFSGSSNLAEARVTFPAPERSAGEDGVTNVYHGLVTLPVAVRPLRLQRCLLRMRWHCRVLCMMLWILLLRPQVVFCKPWLRRR